MALIENIEKKIKLALLSVLIVSVSCVAICIACFVICTNMVTREHENIYVLNGDIPFLAQRTEAVANFEVEARAHINLFHQYFFNLPPDETYIKWSLGKAMYLADRSALRQRKAMEEKGFYSELLASSAVMSITCDSIIINDETREFKYYGKQRIKRITKLVIREIQTVGKLESIERSENNPHGLMIVDWRTISNNDIQTYNI